MEYGITSYSFSAIRDLFAIFLPVLGLQISRLGFWGSRPHAKVHQNGRSSSRIVVAQACKVSRRYLFLLMRNL